MKNCQTIFSNVQAVFPQIIELIEVEKFDVIFVHSALVFYFNLYAKTNNDRSQTDDLDDFSAHVQLLETNFVEKHQGHGLDRVVTTIYVVPQEQIVGPWGSQLKNQKNTEQTYRLPQFLKNSRRHVIFVFFVFECFFFNQQRQDYNPKE